MKIITITLATAISLTTSQQARAAIDYTQTFLVMTIMRLLDTDKNQQIEVSEIEVRWKQAFAMTDKNADKVLTLNEFNALSTVRSAQRKLLDPNSKLPSAEAAFDALDRNKNKEITRWEFNKQAMDRFRQVDTDKNNAISQSELMAVKGILPL